MAQKADAAGGVGFFGLGLGNIVEQPGQLQDGAAGMAVADLLPKILRGFRGPGSQEVDGRVLVSPGNQLGMFHGVQRVVPNVPVMGAGLVNALGQGQLRYYPAQQVQPVQNLQLPPGAVAGQNRQKLVPHPFRGYLADSVSVIPDELGGLRFQTELQLAG